MTTPRRRKTDRRDQEHDAALRLAADRAEPIPPGWLAVALFAAAAVGGLVSAAVLTAWRLL